jgi:hypothetical protein
VATRKLAHVEESCLSHKPTNCGKAVCEVFLKAANGGDKRWHSKNIEAIHQRFGIGTEEKFGMINLEFIVASFGNSVGFIRHLT